VASRDHADGIARARALGAFVELYPPGPGIPVAVKDTIDIAGQTVRSGTAGLGLRTPTRDAECWTRLRETGHVALGRTRVPELTWSVRTPGCANPWHPGRDAGGSSGGSAVAVATGAAPVALGTDTGGSIRIPAALCGVAGLRPTHGAVPLAGVTPMAPSMDTVGPIAATARECLRLFEILSGTRAGSIGPVAGLRVGLPAQLWVGKVDPEVARLVDAAAEALRAAGVKLVDVELPLARRLARGAGYTIMLAESARHWWSAYRDDPAGLTGRAAEMLRAGSLVGEAEYAEALARAAAVRGELDEVFDAVNALLLPTVPVTAAPTDADSVTVGGREEPIETAYYRLTALASVTGHPALTVPAGHSADGLPVGAQLVGPRGAEALLCALGETIEQAGQFRDRPRAGDKTGDAPERRR
jgi:Asp-tRNA(Asn)/Glu-tRNA(Gln) amidotransferase A subunit family amidase